MRGIPIPSLVLQRVSRASEETAKTGKNVSIGDYWLVDGQQRATAMRIGFEKITTVHIGEERIKARLWLDLAWEKEHDRRFGFSLCSMARPWGDAPDLSGRPGASSVWEARKNAGISDGRFDFEVPLTQTWPVAATAPIPFAPLLEWACTHTPEKEELRSKVAQIIDSHSLRSKIPKLTEECRNLSDEYWDRFARGLQRVTQKRLVTAVEADMDPDDLLEAFTRLNRNGTRLPDAELFFSTLKKELPQSNALINTMCTGSHRAFGELNVLRAFTVLATEKVGRDQINSTTLNLDLFKTIKKEKEAGQTFQQCIEEYLTPASNGASQGTKLLDWLIHTLSYRGKNDAGLPAVLLPRLGVRTWLPVLHWVERHGTSEESRETNRDNILRYVLTDLFFADWTAGDDKPLRELLRLVEQKPDFPTLAALVLWSESEELRRKLKIREGKSVWLRRVDFPQASGTGTRGTISVWAPLSPDELAEYRRRFIAHYKSLPDLEWFAWLAHRSHDLLLWSQREAMDQWFKAFLPQIALIGEIGRPWDIDHIVPSDFFTYLDPLPSDSNIKMALKAIAPELESGEWETFRRPRNFLGNKRVWLAGWNRSDHNDPICKKFPEIPERKDDYRVKSDWWNEHVVGRHDALAEASAISFVDEAWKRTPDGKSNWDLSTMQAFLQAVWARENRLYKELFDFLKAGFETDHFKNRV